jgi:hypothetical protein
VVRAGKQNRFNLRRQKILLAADLRILLQPLCRRRIRRAFPLPNDAAGLAGVSPRVVQRGLDGQYLYMSVFGRLRLYIKQEHVEIAAKETATEFTKKQMPGHDGAVARKNA